MEAYILSLPPIYLTPPESLRNHGLVGNFHIFRYHKLGGRILEWWDHDSLLVPVISWIPWQKPTAPSREDFTGHGEDFTGHGYPISPHEPVTTCYNHFDVPIISHDISLCGRSIAMRLVTVHDIPDQCNLLTRSVLGFPGKLIWHMLCFPHRS